MKPTEFIVETSLIAQEADVMHADHEVQMARSDCYSAAKYAIELHRMLREVSEQQGLDGWVSEKITLANDYLRTVHEYLSHEMAHSEEMMQFSEGAANYAFDQMLNEMHGTYSNREKFHQDKEMFHRHDTDTADVGFPGPNAPGWAIGKKRKENIARRKAAQDKDKLKEMATGGASGAGGIATVVAGGGKPGTGKPKKIANSHKPKKVTVGKGIY